MPNLPIKWYCIPFTLHLLPQPEYSYQTHQSSTESCTGLALTMLMFVFPWEAKFISVKLMQGNQTHLCIYILVERELNHICWVPIKLSIGSFCCFIRLLLVVFLTKTNLCWVSIGCVTFQVELSICIPISVGENNYVWFHGPLPYWWAPHRAWGDVGQRATSYAFHVTAEPPSLLQRLLVSP